jgi:esterase/lipase
MDIDAPLQKITQPILCFYGSADEYSFPRQADIIRQLENPEFLDIQIFHRGGNGLTEEKIRPHVLRHLQDFLIKFA